MKYPKFEKYIYRMMDKLWMWWPERTLFRRIAHKSASGYYMCQKCGDYFERGNTHVDHKSPKKPIAGPVRLEDGWLDLNELRRSYLVSIDGMQILCLNCHKEKTSEENKRRLKIRRRKAGPVSSDKGTGRRPRARKDVRGT